MTLPTHAINPKQSVTRHRRPSKPKTPDNELVQIFWAAPNEAFFSQDTVSAVTGRSIKTLECDRWKGSGLPFRKISGRVLYRKSDVVTFLEGHELVKSTSEYSKEK